MNSPFSSWYEIHSESSFGNLHNRLAPITRVWSFCLVGLYGCTQSSELSKIVPDSSCPVACSYEGQSLMVVGVKGVIVFTTIATSSCDQP